MWAQERDDVPPSPKRMISSKNAMASAYFPLRGSIAIEFLRQAEKYNSRFSGHTVLLNSENSV
jgi:hypothetical protein